MASVALLVLGAYAPKTFAIVAEAFCDDFDIYVHVDRKIDLEVYRSGIADPRVVFIDARVSVFWAGFSMISATIALVGAAQQRGIYDYFCLVSDDTVPLLGPAALKREIIQSACVWMDVWKAPPNHANWRRYQRFFFLDSRFSNPRYYALEERFFADSDMRSLLELQSLKVTGKQKLDDLYCGKQWWVLPWPILEKMLSYHADNDIFQLSFRYSAVPDEMYFQTIFRTLFPSEFANGSPVYDDFNRPAKPHVFRDADELRALQAARKISGRWLFIRKLALSEKLDAEAVRDIFWSRRGEEI